MSVIPKIPRASVASGVKYHKPSQTVFDAYINVSIKS
jgi:hypothetical protein